ncbi:cytochrome P450 9e2-like [Calliopsis andreniformis]|uniref:cytochrome P450 9e2-like n=1 Tax=Calliopsis andreniformis TaxID=337506 RepID=UPI003FCE2CC0
MWSLILALVAIVLATYYYYRKSYNCFEERGIPHQKGMPFLGNIWKAILQRITFADGVLELYNYNRDAKYIGFFDMATPVIMVRDIELLKSISVKNFEHFVNHRTIQTGDDDPLFNSNLFGLKDEKWRDVRTMLSPAFTSSKMKAMFLLMRECAQQYGKTLANVPEDKRILELKDAFTKYTNDVIATCAFGINVDSMNDPNNKFYLYGKEATRFGSNAVLKFFILRACPWLAKWLGIRLIRKEITDFFEEVVASTIKARDEKGIVRPDMIQLMMESRGKLGPGKELSILDMTAQAFVFFFGGFESTSTLMCFAAYEVGVNPSIQKKLQEEIDQVLEDCNGEVTYDAINEMKYLDAVINEALRMYPVIVAVDRTCSKPFELPPALPGGKPVLVKKDEIVWIPIYGIHYDPDHYEEPQKFNPDRFVNDSKKILNSGIFWSFGMGPRMCIGNRFALLEAKVLLFHVFANCNLKPCSKTTIPMVLSKQGFQMGAKGGFWFEVEPRKKEQPVLVNSVSSNGVAC